MNFLGWIDHDARHEEEVLRALGAAKGHDARDELGLGTMRDSLADLLFPGLSTIQQRARYFFFVQWCCELASSHSDAGRILEKLREYEVTLIKSLSHLGEGEGVIGILSQEDLERMPSEIYWNGLLILGMREYRGNRQRWARHVIANRLSGRTDVFGDSGPKAQQASGFASDRPNPPAGFPSIVSLNFGLTHPEAEYLRKRLIDACVDQGGQGRRFNLFGAFTKYRRETSAAHAWDHPHIDKLPNEARELLLLAASFAKLMHGAVILYNVCVARKQIEDGLSSETLERHLHSLAEWTDELLPADVDLVRRRLPEFPEFGRLTRHRIDPKTITFVERWLDCCTAADQLANSVSANRLVSDREIYLKKDSGTSRIASKKARARWGGESGGMMDFRWAIAKRCLNDLAAAPDA